MNDVGCNVMKLVFEKVWKLEDEVNSFDGDLILNVDKPTCNGITDVLDNKYPGFNMGVIIMSMCF